ncbi:MAG: class II fructose-bisphosphate aldolase [Patescibacteria group bacterium]
MPLTLREIRENCQKARATMARSRTEHFALGAFNIDNQETLVAVMRAAQKLRAPVLVEITDGEVKALGLENIRDMVDNYKSEYGVEAYINLDHSPSVEEAVAGIEAGFEFIHIDVSQSNHKASDRQIIEATKQVVEYAKFTGALVESESHYFAGGSNIHTEAIDYAEIKKSFSSPDGVAKFVKATGVDTYAVAIGNLHGSYPVPKILDLNLLHKIREKVDCFLSLHGGSGTASHFFEEACRIGVSKVNINTDIRIAYRKTLEKVLREHPEEVAIMKINQEVYDAVQSVVESKLHMFNSAGKAQV